MSLANTKIDSMLSNYSPAFRVLLVAGIAVLMSLPTAALAQITTVPTNPTIPTIPTIPTACGPEVKEAVVKALADVETASDLVKADIQQQLYAKYQQCGVSDSATLAASSTFFVAARECGAVVSNLGSTFFEEMSCSGYDPQRRQFASPVKIKQSFGFGAAQLPGSREYVLHCVANAFNVLVPVGRDSVHLANALGGQPTWQFAVITSATENLQTIQPMNGATRNARSILSWALPPTNCNYQPIWGNALNYRIRLDQ